LDFENIARVVKERRYKQFELKLVPVSELLEKGKIIVRACLRGSGNRFTETSGPFHSGP